MVALVMPLATKAGSTGQPVTCKGCPLYGVGKGFVLEPAPVWSQIKMAIIGEAPGTNEVLQGKPFVGKAGWWLLKNILNPAGLSRKEVYLDNTLRCLPPKNKQGEAYPVGTDKLQAEMHCRQYDRQIPPSVPTMLVGGKALGQKLGLRGISDWHGHVTLLDSGGLVSCTFHPSAVMRQPNLLPVAIREHYNLLTAHANPSILKHPTVVKGMLPDQPGPMVFDLEWDRKTKEISCIGVAYEADKAYSTYDVGEGKHLLANRLANSNLLCGHNIIATGAVGAGVAAKPAIDQCGGSVLVIGTPAEELYGGKILMAQSGAFDNLDMAMLVHPGTRNSATTQALACITLR